MYFAIPVMNEFETLPETLNCISNQDYENIHTYICVNQPESYIHDSNKKYIFQNNQDTLKFLQQSALKNITVIDKSSIGMAWSTKQFGVGWARKTVMDAVAQVANDDDIILSMDADTTFESNFVSEVGKSFNKFPNASGISLPYYHKLIGEDNLDRMMLHYEIYMRHYALNLFRIRNPYCFTAIGSSMGTRVSTYKRLKGISPKLSGEDFYFIQKLRKNGSLIIDCGAKTFPGTRYSDRVFFGTGPALIKGRDNDWSSYPIYDFRLFDKVEVTYQCFDDLFYKDVETPMDDFFMQVFGSLGHWKLIRENFKTIPLFRKSCAEKVDGLRILQFLKSSQLQPEDEKNMKEYLIKFHGRFHEMNLKEVKNFSFSNSSINFLNDLRDYFYACEQDYRQSIGIINWY
jgi:glycosyltransferase involved in cell wall biosynthesis